MSASSGDDGGASRAKSSFAEHLAAARNGEGEEFGNLLDGFREYLLLVANQQVPNDVRPKVAPSDIVQQTFIEAEAGMARFDGDTPEQFRAWLRMILLHNVADVTRQFRVRKMRRVKLEVPLSEGPRSNDGLEIAAADLSPSSHAIAHENADRVVAAMEKLSPDHRRVVELRNLEERPFSEIGRLMDRSPDAASKLWSRAVVRLGEILQDAD